MLETEASCRDSGFVERGGFLVIANLRILRTRVHLCEKQAEPSFRRRVHSKRPGAAKPSKRPSRSVLACLLLSMI